MGMTVQELIEYLRESPQDAEIIVEHEDCDQTGLVKPEVAWISDDKKRCYLGYL